MSEFGQDDVDALIEELLGPTDKAATAVRIALRDSVELKQLRLDFHQAPGEDGVEPQVVSAFLTVDEAVALGRGLVKAAAELQAKIDSELFSFDGAEVV